MESDKNSVLIVDDDAIIRKLLTRYLVGYILYMAADGIEGWEQFEKHAPDVVITDLRMPKRDGLSLFRMIREHSPNTPVIILSGAGKMADAIELLRMGASDYIEKPVHNKEIVIHTVRKALNLLRLEEMNRSYQETLETKIAEKTKALRDELDGRKKAEQEIFQAQKEWMRTFDVIPDLIGIIDRDNNIIRANKAMAEAMDWDRDRGRKGICSTKIPGMFIENGKKHTSDIYDEKLGGHFEVTVVPYFGEDGVTLEGSVHIARNINERKEIEKEREKMQVQHLQTQKLESVGQLAAGIAHEINTPVQFVSTNNEFLGESFGDVTALIQIYERLFQASVDDTVDKNLLEEIAAIREEVDWDYLAEEIPSALTQNQEGLKRVASIVRAMKEFSHPGSREKELQNINEMIQTTTIVARNEWKYIAELDLDLDETLPSVLCFSDDIGQVILNIIINAAHAIEDKLGRNPVGERGKITISSRGVGAYAEIRIQDTGVGMSREVRNKVFDPFFTTKKVGRGTGQGLAIAWNIIKDKHKGQLKVESKEGEGTTFIIKLPL